MISADRVNSSDYEAQHAAIHAAAVAIAAYYSADDGPETEVAQVAYRAMYPIIAGRVRAEAAADERRRIVRDIIALAPVNCELRPDGKEDPLFAAWVEGVGDSARVARGRSE